MDLYPERDRKLEERHRMDEDLWSTDSGLVSDYEGTVVDAWFGIDTNYNADTTLLFWKMSTDVPATPEVTERYSCGPDWHTVDGGKTVIHPTKHRFNKQAQAGILVDKVVELAGNAIRDRGVPTSAATWIGTSWFMEAVTRGGKRRDTGEDWTSTKNFPAKFLGDSPITAGETPAVGGSVVPLGGLDGPTVEKITALAKMLTHAEWVDKVMEVEGVLANDTLVIALPDYGPGSLYEELRNQ